MSKAILVIEIPEDFDYRKCSIGGDGNIYYERKHEQRTSIIGNIKNLKLMPEKMLNIAQVENGIVMNKDDMKYMAGYNKCIDEILGE